MHQGDEAKVLSDEVQGDNTRPVRVEITRDSVNSSITLIGIQGILPRKELRPKQQE